MESVDTSGSAFVAFWPLMAEQGELNKNTAGSFRAAAKAVLEVDSGWEQIDVRTLDVERLLHRFANKAATQMKSESIRTYQNRFRQALESFLKFADNPATWRSPAQSGGPKPDASRGTKKGAAKRATPNASETERDSTVSTAFPVASGPGMIEYPFALRGGSMIVRMKLPVDLTGEEVDRLYGFLKAVAVAGPMT
jgi:hypothetical protein